MNQAQILQMLTNPDLTIPRRAALEAKLHKTVPPSQSSYDPTNDAEFEGWDDFYALHRGDFRFGGENPLAKVGQTPTGRLWHRCFTIGLLGGLKGKAEEDVLALLAVLRVTRSQKVREKVSRALRSRLRSSADELSAELVAEVTQALSKYAEVSA